MPSIAAHTRVSLENTRMYSTTTESLPRSTTSSTIARMASPAPNAAVLPIDSPNKPLTEDKYNHTESATKQCRRPEDDQVVEVGHKDAVGELGRRLPERGVEGQGEEEGA